MLHYQELDIRGCRAKNLVRYWVDITIVPFLDETNRPDQYFAISNDITKYKEVD
jgi:hypothetical protein